MIPLPCEKSGYGAPRSRRHLMIAGIGREIQSPGLDTSKALGESLTNVRRNRPAAAGAHSPGSGNAMALWFRQIEAPHHSIPLFVSVADPRDVFDPRKDRRFAFTPSR
jgi:hypothetical protein